MVFLSNRLCKRNKISQPCNSGRCRRNASRASRRTRLRVTARGAYFLPITSPKRAGPPVGRPYTTKCSVRDHGRKRKTDENSSVFSSLAAFGKLATRVCRANSFGLLMALNAGGLSSVKCRHQVSASALNSPTLAAFSTARIDNFTAASGLHTDPETMSTLTARNGRLICTFHVALTYG